MTTRPIVLFAGSLLFLAAASSARAGIVTYTDIDEWRAAASQAGTGVVTEIDFETRPDGTPTPFQELVEITPDFNYTDQGVTFSTPVPDLYVYDSGGEAGGLLAALHFSGSGGRTWIIADFVMPAAAVGVVFGGNTSIAIFAPSGDLLAEVEGGDSGRGLFVGVTAGTPVGSVIVDRGASFQNIESFLFTPIPEPGMLLLLGAGAVALLRRKRR